MTWHWIVLIATWIILAATWIVVLASWRIHGKLRQRLDELEGD